MNGEVPFDETVSYFLDIFFMAVIFAFSSQASSTGLLEFRYIDGTVKTISGNEAVVSLNSPGITSTSDDMFSEISWQITRNALFIEGTTIEINNEKASVMDITDNTLRILFKKQQSCSAGSQIRLRVSKKTIAIADFAVIKGSFKEAGYLFAENLTTALIKHGDFNVVERSKLQPLVEELSLAQSGLTEKLPEKTRQKLLIADIIIIGSIAEVGNVYEVNIRLLNVMTGIAIGAINAKIPLFTTAGLKDSSSWNEDFEGIPLDYSWRLGKITNYGFVSIDNTIGAEGSNKSIRLDYAFRDLKERNCPNIRNNKKRDASLFKGIEFYVKASYLITAYVSIDISDKDDLNLRDRWFARFNAGQNWVLINIPFNQFTYFKSEPLIKEGFKPGRQVFDLSRFESISVGTCNYMVTEESKRGFMWIDNVRFYK